MDARRELLGDALECDDREMSPVGEEKDREIDLDSGLTSNEGPRESTRRSSRPSRTGFVARRPIRRPTPMVDLIRGCTAQPGMRPVAVVPGEVEGEFLLEFGEAARDQDQTSRALGFERSHAALDHRQAPMLVERSEAELNPPTPTPPPESLRKELLAPVGDEVTRPRP